MGKLGISERRLTMKEVSKSTRGRTAKNKGATFERSIASLFEKYLGVKLSRTPQSGGFAKSNSSSEFKGDITCIEEGVTFNLSVECKNQKTWALPKWLEQSETECPEGKIPCVVFHKHGTNKNYITLPLEEFLNIVDRDTLIEEEK